ncbi:hypothetical protein BU24DRAFT_423325 [Aaosphaeria arxii CBS 175.79]|uniref:F-box domain-containing protein n=1 Tax=Aaosphaeria arxii CBS 175.79 TaxID=1450172 RepID=A0A6A5XN42_9PLEO|nr:uncharacterized protein BU24DRAFT_423325 [Aaosphaeria arxii CBS 175.79]KAF2014343.1 hypothetical protein BU24DRAFT_423325 [Aaosphaeria arxii CBS 175.79]
MLFLPRWVQRWRKKARRVEQIKARESLIEQNSIPDVIPPKLDPETATRSSTHQADKGTRIQEKQNNRQVQPLIVPLKELQRGMDPLIAVQVYNNRFCHLTRLPEEILLMICYFLCDDAVTLLCLRIVSRVFLRILNRQSMIWRGPWHQENFEHDYGDPFYLRSGPRLQLRLQLRLRLRRDGRCNNCRRWNDAHSKRLWDDCKFQQDFFRSPLSSLYCYACKVSHDRSQFASAYQGSTLNERETQCLGHQGSVQVCKHIHITWASIKAHIDDWRQKQPQHGGDWQACLSSFKIECHDAIHDTRCTGSEEPTWPRASLRTAEFRSSNVVLKLEWRPHSRLDALSLTVDGRMLAEELRTLFYRLRSLGPADTLYPPCHWRSPPELALFRPPRSSITGHFTAHKTGEDDALEPFTALLLSLPLRKGRLYNGYGYGANGRRLEIRPHQPADAGGTSISSQCLIVTYERDILICTTIAMEMPATKIVPTHSWLHAMDPRTYAHPQADIIRPDCKDATCFNYYLRQKLYFRCHIGSSA